MCAQYVDNSSVLLASPGTQLFSEDNMKNGACFCSLPDLLFLTNASCSYRCLLHETHGTAESNVHEDRKMHSTRIYACREPDAVGIIIEEISVLTDLGNPARACCLLLGVTYALNLQYPSKLYKAFEVFQRLFVGLDTLRPKPTSKFVSFKNKLLS
ncbi:hypothetical protein ANANG_G00100310 [Anguilla anguilla]|uniref:Uncharacterized protein n=1 Tax=Anguilla anguilla TaxID=7936 RepID=A0A9D3S385_ANGAN|nr:hypothetical protein ANANG_G00100310 [Anguilla anguilla]